MKKNAFTLHGIVGMVITMLCSFGTRAFNSYTGIIARDPFFGFSIANIFWLCFVAFFAITFILPAFLYLIYGGDDK
jgi:hypothetical protein